MLGACVYRVFSNEAGMPSREIGLEITHGELVLAIDYARQAPSSRRFHASCDREKIYTFIPPVPSIAGS